MRLPGSVLQGILARASLMFLRVYLGVVFLLSSVPGLAQEPDAGYLDLAQAYPWLGLIVGITLIVGLATRFFAMLALLLSINYLGGALGGGVAGWLAGASGAQAAIALGLVIGAAGRTLGLDSVLARRWPRSPFW
jgi:hypothetical protein